MSFQRTQCRGPDFDQMDHEHQRAERLAEELARFHAGAHDMHRMQNVHRVNRVQHIANLRQNINTLQQIHEYLNNS